MEMDSEHQNNVEEESSNQMEDSVPIEEISVPVPKGHWRFGVPCKGTKAIFLRYAHKDDRKREKPSKKEYREAKMDAKRPEERRCK